MLFSFINDFHAIRLALVLFNILAGEKLQLRGEGLYVVLEKDGTEVDEDEILECFKAEVLMILEDTQIWEPDVPKDTVVIQASEIWQNDSRRDASMPSTSTAGLETEASPARMENEATPARMENETTQIVVPVSQKQKLTLPAFSDYIVARLNSNDSHLCWNKMITEAAYFYLGKYPNIGKDNGTGDYKTIGQKMIQTFPSVGRPGAQPWSCFTKALSQKMRTLRHNEKTKSLTSTQPCTSSSPKQIKLAKEVSNNVMSADEHYEEHVAEMKREFEKQKPDQVHLKQLIKQTFRKRREWISNQPSGQTKAIVEEFPWIVKRSNMMLEMKLILGIDHLTPLADNLTNFFEAISSLKPGGKECADDLDILKAVEYSTGLKHGKGCKTKSVIAVHKGVQEAALPKVLSSRKLAAPSLALIVNDENELDKQYIIGDECSIDLETESLREAYFMLICWYYITDLDYPRFYSQLLGFGQQLVFKQPFLSQKSAGFVHFLEKVEKQMQKVSSCPE